MKLRVVGWAWYDDDLPQGNVSWAARNAIIDDIKKNDYLFSGLSHQEALDCAPVLNDGKIYRFSQQGWGDVMAEAHGFFGRKDYARFSFGINEEKEVRPLLRFDEDNFIPETDLSEKFTLCVNPSVFRSAQKTAEIKLEVLHKLRYLDKGDNLELICGEDKAEYKVESVERKKDLTAKKRRELEFAMRDFQDEEKMKLAEKEYDEAKVILLIKSEKP